MLRSWGVSKQTSVYQNNPHDAADNKINVGMEDWSHYGHYAVLEVFESRLLYRNTFCAADIIKIHVKMMGLS